MKIRPADNDDLGFLKDAMKKVLEDLQNELADPYLAEALLRGSNDIEPRLTDALEETDSTILVAEEDLPIAFIMGSLNRPSLPLVRESVGIIEVCWVDPDHRRRGIAKQLVQALEKWFQSRDIEFIELSYLVGNIPAEITWSALGYQPFRITSRKQLGQGD